MTILDSSNLIFAIFGRAADSNTAAILAASNDKNAAINTLLSSGAGFQSNAEFVNAVYTNTMGAELANSPLVALWTTLLDAGMMDKAQFVSQTMSFLDAVASVPAFAQVPFVQTFQARSQVSLSTASNSGVLNSSQLTAILQATTDAATANIAIASANEAKAGAALSADVVKLAQVNIANLASKDASGFAAKLIEQSNVAAAQINAPVIDAANPAAFVAQHGAEVASIAQAAGSTQAAANIAQATNEARAQSGLEPASPVNPATPTTPANPDQGATPATPATPATAGNAGGAATNAGGYVPQNNAPATPASPEQGNAPASPAAPSNPVVVEPQKQKAEGDLALTALENKLLEFTDGADNVKITGVNKTFSLADKNAVTGTLDSKDNVTLNLEGDAEKTITLAGGNEKVVIGTSTNSTIIGLGATGTDKIGLGDGLSYAGTGALPAAQGGKHVLANNHVYTNATAPEGSALTLAQGSTAYILVTSGANVSIHKVTGDSKTPTLAPIATVNAITPADLLAKIDGITQDSTIQATLTYAKDSTKAIELGTTAVSGKSNTIYNIESNAFTANDVNSALAITAKAGVVTKDKAININLKSDYDNLNEVITSIADANTTLTLGSSTATISTAPTNIDTLKLAATTTTISEAIIEALASTGKTIKLGGTGTDKTLTISAATSADGLDISGLKADSVAANLPTVKITGLGNGTNKTLKLSATDGVKQEITVAADGASITGLDDKDVVDLHSATFTGQADWTLATALPNSGGKLTAKTIYAISNNNNAFENEAAAKAEIAKLTAAKASDQNLFLAKVTNQSATDTIIYHTVAGENGALTNVEPTKIVSLLGTADIKSPVYTLKIDGYAVTDAL